MALTGIRRRLNVAMGHSVHEQTDESALRKQTARTGPGESNLAVEGGAESRDIRPFSAASCGMTPDRHVWRKVAPAFRGAHAIHYGTPNDQSELWLAAENFAIAPCASTIQSGQRGANTRTRLPMLAGWGSIGASTGSSADY